MGGEDKLLRSLHSLSGPPCGRLTENCHATCRYYVIYRREQVKSIIKIREEYKMYSEHDVPDQSGKTVFITGANTGLGFETARILALHGARVLIGCRSAEKAEKAMKKIREEAPHADLTFVALDLNSLDSVKKAAEQVRNEKQLDILINNAGIMTPPFRRTDDGFESQLGVNHFGHFALTGWLLPKMLEQKNGRIVSLSSLGHKTGKINFDDIQCEGKYDAMERYTMSKLANALFVRELNKRLIAKGSNVVCVASHPGVADTELSRNFGFFGRTIVLPVIRLLKVFNTPLEGALPSLMASTEANVEPGAIYGPVKRGETARSAKKGKYAKRALNEDDAKRLWSISEELTGVKYPV